MNKLVLASGNAGKVKEINNFLQANGINVISQNEFDVPEAIEDGLTFVENAIKKARNACAHTGLPSLADDSGIEVDAINKAPGIYSARFSGEAANDEKNNIKLLAELDGVAESERTARYQCIMVYMESADDPTPIITQGSLEGRILTKARGDGGFGYDPLFWLEDKNCSAAELSLEEKNKISHRAIALQAMIQKLSNT